MASSDLDRVREWRNHPTIRSVMFTQHLISAEEHLSWWESVRTSTNQRYFLFESDGVDLGVVAFNQMDASSRTAFWAFYAAPDAPRGTGTLMEFRALELFFRDLGMRKLSCEVIGTNQKVLALHQRFGFVEEGIFRRHVLLGGALEDVHRLALFDDVWNTRRSSIEKEIVERILG